MGDRIETSQSSKDSLSSLKVQLCHLEKKARQMGHRHLAVLIFYAALQAAEEENLLEKNF